LYLNKSQAFSPPGPSRGPSDSNGHHSSSQEDTVDIAAEKDEVKFFSPCIELRAGGGGGGVLVGGNEKKIQKLLQHSDEKRAAANQIHVWLDENALKKQKLYVLIFCYLF